MNTGATFSHCRRYRWTLWREWDSTKPVCLFIMLNPSTADATANDPTVERCQRRAAAMGYGRLEVRNLFALRATDPAELLVAGALPIGLENDLAIMSAADAARDSGGMIICAWGSHLSTRWRAKPVLSMLREAGHALHCLGVNADGQPKHPLYVGYTIQPQEFKP